MVAVSIYCPHCHRFTALQPAPVVIGPAWERGKVAAIWVKSSSETWWMGICNNCLEPVLVLNGGDEVYPTPSVAPSDPNIPDAIRADLDEAKRCFQVQAWRAVAVMARRTIQSAAMQKGANGENLVSQISSLATLGVITADIKEWATVVRWVGNDGAHPGGQAVTKEDAEDILKLAEQLLTVVYVTPALASARRAIRGK